MGSVTTQPGIEELLEQAGARPPRYGRGKWARPNHSGSPAVSVDAERGLFNCHHAGCNFHGGLATLRRRIGIEREWLPKAEWLRQRELSPAANPHGNGGLAFRRLDIGPAALARSGSR